MTKITEYTLDVSKWRCGRDGEYALGKGVTELLNDEGYMCCLGQFAEQAGVEKTILNGKVTPAEVYRALYPPLRDDGSDLNYDDNFLDVIHLSSGPVLVSSDLASDLMDINDSEQTTPNEKIALITSKLAEHNISLNVLDPNNQLEAFK